MAKKNEQSGFPTVVDESTYPKPPHRFEQARIGMTWESSRPDYPPMPRAPGHAPNVVIVLLDDAGYGVASAYGGLVRTPTAEKIAQQGLQYCQFHTTAICAPTRAALLTGRNAHSVSQGIVAEYATGYPGYTGIIPRSTALLSEILSPNGYATGWWGKNHNVPDNCMGPAGPFDNWPLQRGFDYFYGFLGGETDNFYPALVRGNTQVDPPKKPEEGYHLTTDLADDCITWMRNQKAIAPQRPLFVHFAPVAAHGPHQPPAEWRGRNKGRFDMGWDRYREEVFDKQRELGVIPEGTRLTPRPKEIPAWDDFPPEQQRLFARQMETFADFHEHADYEIGRMVSALEEMGEFDNTLFIYILGDNGSSAEGSLVGTLNETATMSGLDYPVEKSLARIDEIGLPGTTPHYAVGWAWAGDAPFQWMKQVASHFGGTRNGMVVSWPAWIADRGAKRFQFHHVIDIVPTILEVAGIAEPHMINGVTQKPLEGTSLAYTFDRENAEAPSRHTTQYFEVMGNRAIYHDGWIASCRHGRLPWKTSGSADFDQDVWELYDVTNDYSQSEDLAQKHPERLRKLQELFLVEAAKYDVLPLDDRFVERADITLRPNFFTGRKQLVLPPTLRFLQEGAAPKFNNVDHLLDLIAHIPDGGAEGVLVAMGGDGAGWSLFVDGGKLRYHYNFCDIERYDVVADEPLPTGRVAIRLEFVCDDPKSVGAPATVRLHLNGKQVAEGRIAKQIRGRYAFGECLDVGRDSRSPVWPGYRSRLPFEFTGHIEGVRVELGEAAERTTGELIEEHLHFE
jgi:arylsulfatase